MKNCPYCTQNLLYPQLASFPCPASPATMRRHVPAGWPQARCTVAGFAALVRANTTAITTEGGGGQRQKQVDGVDRESCGNV